MTVQIAEARFVRYKGRDFALCGPFPPGICQCGCLQPTPNATRNESRRGHVKGQPLPYLPAHGKRPKGPAFEEQDRGYVTPCWIWLRGCSGSGYGEIVLLGDTLRAYRLIYETHYGPLPKGYVPDHLCRVKSCVNPEHLQPVPMWLNSRDGAARKLTPSLAEEIKRQVERRGADLARELHISPQLVCDVRKGRKWCRL